MRISAMERKTKNFSTFDFGWNIAGVDVVLMLAIEAFAYRLISHVKTNNYPRAETAKEGWRQTRTRETDSSFDRNWPVPWEELVQAPRETGSSTERNWFVPREKLVRAPRGTGLSFERNWFEQRDRFGLGEKLVWAPRGTDSSLKRKWFLPLWSSGAVLQKLMKTTVAVFAIRWNINVGDWVRVIHKTPDWNMS